MHEVASTTMGSAPLPLHSHRRSTVRFAISTAPSRKPFEVHGVAQQWPATSRGIQSGSPARADTSTSAARHAARGPKMRLMQAGK